MGVILSNKKKNWNDQQWDDYVESILNNNFSTYEKLEILLFSTLNKMGLKNKVILQRIEEKAGGVEVSTINQNSDGTIKPSPCKN